MKQVKEKQKLTFVELQPEKMGTFHFRGKPTCTVARCPRCKKTHSIRFGTDMAPIIRNLIGFVMCKGRSYLVTFNEKEL